VTRSGCSPTFAHQQTGKQSLQLDLGDLDAPLIGAFLAHLISASMAIGLGVEAGLLHGAGPRLEVTGIKPTR
jgi:hypothetical protein